MFSPYRLFLQNNNDEAFEANRSGKDNRRRLVVLLQRIFIDVLQVRPKVFIPYYLISWTLLILVSLIYTVGLSCPDRGGVWWRPETERRTRIGSSQRLKGINNHMIISTAYLLQRFMGAWYFPDNCDIPPTRSLYERVGLWLQVARFVLDFINIWNMAINHLLQSCSYSLVLDIGHKECKAVACADGCVLLSTFTGMKVHRSIDSFSRYTSLTFNIWTTTYSMCVWGVHCKRCLSETSELCDLKEPVSHCVWHLVRQSCSLFEYRGVWLPTLIYVHRPLIVWSCDHVSVCPGHPTTCHWVSACRRRGR